MNAMKSAEYFAQPQVSEAIDALEEVAFAARERGEADDAIPDAMAFLQERGVELPDEGGVHLMLSVEEAEATPEQLLNKPLRPICPDGSGECFPRNCKWIKGEYVCSWVCRCE